MALKNVAKMRTTCPICHKNDWCMISEDYKLVLCRRIESNHPNTKGGWYHSLEENIQYDKTKFTPTVLKERAPAYMTHVVYSKILQMIDLSAKHHAHLRMDRLLSNGEVFKNDFKSFDENIDWQYIINHLKECFNERILLATPGFYKEGNDIKFIAEQGFVIPILNAEQYITALQVRLDNPTKQAKYKLISSSHKNEGTSSGTPCHVSYPQFFENRNSLLITEGAFKAYIASQRLNVTTIGLVGVDNQSDLLETIRDIKEYLNVTAINTITIAYDIDAATNEFVKLALDKLINLLLENGYTVKLAKWNERYGKGIDDVLLRNSVHYKNLICLEEINREQYAK